MRVVQRPLSLGGSVVRGKDGPAAIGSRLEIPGLATWAAPSIKRAGGGSDEALDIGHYPRRLSIGQCSEAGDDEPSR